MDPETGTAAVDGVGTDTFAAYTAWVFGFVDWFWCIIRTGNDLCLSNIYTEAFRFDVCLSLYKLLY